MPAGNQSYMAGGQGSTFMPTTPSGTASLYNSMGFYNPYGYNGTGTPNPTYGTNPMMSAMGMGMGPWGMPPGYGTAQGWVGSMMNPMNMLYNQGMTDRATRSQGGTSFTGYPAPPTPPASLATGTPGATATPPAAGTPPANSPTSGRFSLASGVGMASAQPSGSPEDVRGESRNWARQYSVPSPAYQHNAAIGQGTPGRTWGANPFYTPTPAWNQYAGY